MRYSICLFLRTLPSFICICIDNLRLNLQMGLGKTLTAISVLWSFVRRGGCKGVIVCPSSLVDNWEKEIKKWMGVKLKALCVRSTAGTGVVWCLSDDEIFVIESAYLLSLIVMAFHLPQLGLYAFALSTNMHISSYAMFPLRLIYAMYLFGLNP